MGRTLVPALVLSAAACGFDGSGIGGEAGPGDADPDGRSAQDAGETPPCPPADEDTVALYPFEGQLVDAAGDHDGTANGGGSLAFVDGPSGCGEALEFPESGGQAWIEVPDDPAWDLESGSIDLYVRVHTPDPNRKGTVLSRDASQFERPGHFEIYVLGDGSFALRIQDQISYFVCTDQTFDEGQWVHVGVNLGAPAVELWLDGALVDYEGPSHESLDQSCGPGPAEGIDGNDNPWVFGASIANSLEGDADDIRRHFQGGAIDHLRISRARRPFGGTGIGP